MLIYHSRLDYSLVCFLRESIKAFSSEIDNFCIKNDSYNFYEWATERTFLSLFINSIIRNDSNGSVSAIQEYVVNEYDTSSKGRCDALIQFDEKNAIIIESKFQKYVERVDDSHWIMENWVKYDDFIYNQLNWYFESEKDFYTMEDRYSNIYLLTIVFKVIGESSVNHLHDAEIKLDTGKTLKDRLWYYDCIYPQELQIKDSDKEVGIEIFGSVKKVVNSK